MPSLARSVPRERLDPPIRALGGRVPRRRDQRRRGDPRRTAPHQAGRVDPPVARGEHGRPATRERRGAAPVRERGRADRAGRRPPASGPRAGGPALGRRDESPPAGLREPPHSGVDGASDRHRARRRARRWLDDSANRGGPVPSVHRDAGRALPLCYAPTPPPWCEPSPGSGATARRWPTWRDGSGR